MKNDIASIADKRPPFWIVLIIGTIISCIAANLLALVYQFGGFTPWKSLPVPPSKVTHIVEADPDNVWIETSDGLIYSLTFYCPQSDTCRTWQIVNEPTDIAPIHFYELSRGKDCENLNESAFPKNPLIGKIDECILAPAYGVPDPEGGYETYFVLMKDGTLRYWRHGNSLLGFYFFFFVSSIGGSLLGVVGISKFYSGGFYERRSKKAG